ncbi:RNA polymerase sigma-70 factor (ECF subfamily) [Brevundimonas nasdae]|jgi:RNA polymerase sigma factor (sigma-70 family)|uniref:RNA polymerase sigma factor n=1 Tax=Brevundimonas nasdae TaxID=172043 RepID=A0ABX8TKV6_9CAUL|nr:RNA polymerase sigma factor [Brevundimonas nasdae]MBK6025889.1 RNA polymerase sigma factor [Brevundimonas nasdae]MDQ0452663.1 RNA polymerase sigma-70 factor (ECF subfamily) [Brevundimonas nasdae]QYC11866.1 RNA polymerase sigma factor [Brevundimonas nasdae]QYC14652.1 RNA polymerase sigma factor [Brevundimonas nasdae]
MTSPPTLVETYLLQRQAMTRFFQSRLGAEADVEDLVQELYLKVIALDAEQAQVQNPRAYLYRLASNLLIDRWRGWQRSRQRDTAWRDAAHVEGVTPEADGAPSPEAIVIDRDRLERIVRVVQKLPARTQSIFRLHKFDGVSHAEVAARLGISRSSVEKHMMDALRAITEKLER